MLVFKSISRFLLLLLILSSCSMIAHVFYKPGDACGQEKTRKGTFDPGDIDTRGKSKSTK